MASLLGREKLGLLLIIFVGDAATCYELEVQETQCEVKDVFEL